MMDFSNLKIADNKIKILGTGCSNCTTLETNTIKAVKELNIEVTVEKETDIQKIMGYGILSSPGLVINDKVVMSGRVPGYKEIIDLIKKNI